MQQKLDWKYVSSKICSSTSGFTLSATKSTLSSFEIWVVSGLCLRGLLRICCCLCLWKWRNNITTLCIFALYFVKFRYLDRIMNWLSSVSDVTSTSITYTVGMDKLRQKTKETWRIFVTMGPQLQRSILLAWLSYLPWI